MHTFGGSEARTAGEYLNPVSDDKGAVETNAKLANQLGVLFLIPGQLLHEGGGAGLGNGTQMVDDLLAGHANTVVLDGQGVGLAVGADADTQLGLVFQQLRLGDGFEAQLVGRIRGVGNQFAQKDFLVRVHRVNHEVQQLLHLCLESQGFLMSVHGHNEASPFDAVQGKPADSGDAAKMGTFEILSRAWRQIRGRTSIRAISTG